MTSEEISRLCAGHPVQQVPGFTGMVPWRKRKDEVDPETVLKRKDKVIKPLHEGQWCDPAVKRDKERQRVAKQRAKAVLREEWA